MRARSWSGTVESTDMRFFIAMILLMIVLGSYADREKKAQNGAQPAK